MFAATPRSASSTARMMPHRRRGARVRFSLIQESAGRDRGLGEVPRKNEEVIAAVASGTPGQFDRGSEMSASLFSRRRRNVKSESPSGKRTGAACVGLLGVGGRRWNGAARQPRAELNRWRAPCASGLARALQVDALVQIQILSPVDRIARGDRRSRTIRRRRGSSKRHDQ